MIQDPNLEEKLAYAKAKIAKLERQNELERQWFFELIDAIGECRKCRFFAVCGPRYDCKTTLNRKLIGHVKKALT
jgi:hypothetical protein